MHVVLGIGLALLLSTRSALANSVRGQYELICRAFALPDSPDRKGAQSSDAQAAPTAPRSLPARAGRIVREWVWDNIMSRMIIDANLLRAIGLVLRHNRGLAVAYISNLSVSFLAASARAWSMSTRGALLDAAMRRLDPTAEILQQLPRDMAAGVSAAAGALKAASGGDEGPSVESAAMAIVASWVAQWALDGVATYLREHVQNTVDTAVSTMATRALLRQDVAVMHTAEGGALRAGAQRATYCVAEAMQRLPFIVRILTDLGLAIYALVTADLTLATVCMIIPVVSSLVSQGASYVRNKVNDLTNTAGKQARRSREEVIRNLRTLQSLAAEDQLTQHVLAAEDALTDQYLQAVPVLSLLSQVQPALRSAVQLITTMLAMDRIRLGYLTTGQFAGPITHAARRMEMGVSQMLNIGYSLQSYATGAEEFLKLLDRKPRVQLFEDSEKLGSSVATSTSALLPPPSSVPLLRTPSGNVRWQCLAVDVGADPAVNSNWKYKQMVGDITCKNVVFTYGAWKDAAAEKAKSVGAAATGDGGKSALQGASFSIRAGQTVALVSESGGGKSTLFKLLQQFYLPDSGEIYIDELPMSCYSARGLRRIIGYVEQECTLLNMSIRDNLLLGIDRGSLQYPTQDQVESACKAANIHDVIAALPSGYDTVLGEGGMQLSGGQRQRLSIARAFVRDPAILLLDEVTAQLDGKSEQAVVDGLEQLMHGRTVLVAAHRLSTVVDADRILFLQGGRVAASGTHAQLYRSCPAYVELVQRQMMAGQKLAAALGDAGGSGGSSSGGSRAGATPAAAR